MMSLFDGQWVTSPHAVTSPDDVIDMADHSQEGFSQGGSYDQLDTKDAYSI